MWGKPVPFPWGNCSVQILQEQANPTCMHTPVSTLLCLLLFVKASHTLKPRVSVCQGTEGTAHVQVIKKKKFQVLYYDN